MPQPPFQKALNTAVRLLARRDHSTYELKEKLRARGVVEDIIGRVVVECRRWHYLNDSRTAEICIRQLHRKGFGVHRIRATLKRKRLDDQSTETMLHDLVAAGKEAENARRIAHKKLKLLAGEPDQRKRRQKVYRYLLSRGFSDAVIADVLRAELQ